MSNITERVPMTQEEFDRFAVAALELYSDEWYSNEVLIAISSVYNFGYKDQYE